jgi:translation initiation factor IF-3
MQNLTIDSLFQITKNALQVTGELKAGELITSQGVDLVIIHNNQTKPIERVSVDIKGERPCVELVLKY